MTHNLVNAMNTDKKELRHSILSKRDAILDADRAKKSGIIIEKIIGLPAYESADHVLLYASYGSEVVTDALFAYAKKDNKKVYYPKSYIEGDIPTLRFYEVSELSKLTNGYKGIREPEEKVLFDTKAAQGKILVILPGVGFDRNCNRMGYGKGFYDRFLENLYNKKENADLFVAGLCFDEQLCDIVPTDEHDRQADCVVTPGCIYYKDKQITR